MEQPRSKSSNRVLMFSILMVGALASVMALFRMAKPEAKSVVGGIPLPRRKKDNP